MLNDVECGLIIGMVTIVGLDGASVGVSYLCAWCLARSQAGLACRMGRGV